MAVGLLRAAQLPWAEITPAKGTLVVVTFDESDFEATFTAGKRSTYDGPNQIYTVLLGDMLEPAFRQEDYKHYSLLRTIERNFNLGRRYARTTFNASWFQFLEGREFRWEPAPPSPFTGAGCLAAAVEAQAPAIGVELITGKLPARHGVQLCPDGKAAAGAVPALMDDVANVLPPRSILECFDKHRGSDDANGRGPNRNLGADRTANSRSLSQRTCLQ